MRRGREWGLNTNEFRPLLRVARSRLLVLLRCSRWMWESERERREKMLAQEKRKLCTSWLRWRITESLREFWVCNMLSRGEKSFSSATFNERLTDSTQCLHPECPEEMWRRPSKKFLRAETTLTWSLSVERQSFDVVKLELQFNWELRLTLWLDWIYEDFAIFIFCGIFLLCMKY